MEIKCIITDDEPIARKGLREYIGRVGFLTLAGECEDAIQLNDLLNVQQTDLLFLDIEMPRMSGLELLETLPHPPMAIITSAYEKYALDGYRFDVADYLLKPIPFDRFLKAVNKVRALLENRAGAGAANHIFVKSDAQLKKILLDEILFVESMENYVVIRTDGGKMVVALTLKQVAGALPAAAFMQTHRSFIVNLSRVDAIEGNQLVIGTHKIPVSRNFHDPVAARLLNDRLILKK